MFTGKSFRLTCHFERREATLPDQNGIFCTKPLFAGKNYSIIGLGSSQGRCKTCNCPLPDPYAIHQNPQKPLSSALKTCTA